MQTLEEIAPRWKVDCWQCGGEGDLEGECTCGEDSCCCFDPEPPACGVCRGLGFLVVSRLTDDNCENARPYLAAAIRQPKET